MKIAICRYKFRLQREGPGLPKFGTKDRGAVGNHDQGCCHERKCCTGKTLSKQAIVQDWQRKGGSRTKSHACLWANKRSVNKGTENNNRRLRSEGEVHVSGQADAADVCAKPPKEDQGSVWARGRDGCRNEKGQNLAAVILTLKA